MVEGDIKMIYLPVLIAKEVSQWSVVVMNEHMEIKELTSSYPISPNYIMCNFVQYFLKNRRLPLCFFGQMPWQTKNAAWPGNLPLKN